MRVLSKKSFDEYRSLLEGLEEKALSGFSKKCKAIAVAFMNASDEEERSVYRSLIIDEVYGRIDLSTAQAQAYADDMFMAITGTSPSPHDPMPYEKADARVRSAASHVFGRGDVGEFVRVLGTFISEEVRGAASNAIAENVEEANK